LIVSIDPKNQKNAEKTEPCLVFDITLKAILDYVN
jgi:hypothetical protein